MSFSFATFLSINLISSFCTQLQLSALTSSFCTQKKFLHCLGLINMLSANQHGKIFACILLFVQQVKRQIVQCNIPCHRHSSQHSCCRRRCKKHKSVLFWATRLATLQQIFQSLRSVTLSLQLVSQRPAASSNEITPSNFFQLMFL